MTIRQMRFPTCAEWDALVKATRGENAIMHWKDIFSWCQDASPMRSFDFSDAQWDDLLKTANGSICISQENSALLGLDFPQASKTGRAVRGYSLDDASYCDSTMSDDSVGFRPVFESLESADPDGTITGVGTLYMGDEPVKVPSEPTWRGDIADHIPGAKLELREALADSAYQVQAIKVGNILVSDRVLVKNISWNAVRRAIKPPRQPREKQ